MSKFGNIDLQLSEFVPYLKFWTGHSQTILGHLVPSPEADFPFEKEILDLPDGDQLLIEFYQGKQPYTLSVYHGLGGDAQADYMQRSALLAKNLGWNIVLVNHRGASTLASAEKSYHSGRGEDAEAVIQWARRRFPNTKQIALGFSMSGSILLNLVTKRHGQHQPDVAIVVNAPLDLKTASHKLTKGFNKVYDVRFFFNLKKAIQARKKIKMPLWGKTMDIDRLYTAPVNNFKDPDDYYEKCSAKNYLNRIQTKTFVLSALDDPFIDGKDYLKGAWTNDVHLTLVPYGGHMGYFSQKKNPKFGHRWLDHYLEQVFAAILRHDIA